MVTDDSCDDLAEVNSYFEDDLRTVIAEGERAGVFEDLEGEVDCAFHFVDLAVLTFSLLQFVRGNAATCHVGLPNGFYLLKTV